MSSETLYEAPRKRHIIRPRPHDYLYDSHYIVSGARDYARAAFKAAMASAQPVIQPIFKSMFSDLRTCSRVQVVYHPNCRLPAHINRSYHAYLSRVEDTQKLPTPHLGGKDRFKFSAAPKKLLAMNSATPDFHPSTPVYVNTIPTKPRNRATQSLFRESSAQTIPWQPDGKAADTCEETPEVLFLDKLEWGPGTPYRLGDLPADFHTTEIINKMRHARIWTEVAEKGVYPRWMKRRDQIICDIETKDWIFREAEIDELQDIRLVLLHELQRQQRSQQASRTSVKLSKLWARKKDEMEAKIDHIRKSRDRELRKLSQLHGSGGRAGLVQRMRAARGRGDVTHAASSPLSGVFAPLARHGLQARGRHAEISYDPSLLLLEDHLALSAPPAWLEQCGQNLKKSCSGHHLPNDPMRVCERESKWSEEYLANLHNDLIKARLGATVSAGPLRVLKPRRLVVTPRPATPQVESVPEEEEANHQAALVLQRIIRGRAVQCLMYEGRRRAAELTEELKTTHGLQREDKIRIAKDEAKARDYNALRTEAEQKEDVITALVDELCGGAVAAALDFLEKELRRLKDERKQHAFILIALREKSLREAAEAGRRQKEEHRRREHDEMFKQILGLTQETVDVYLRHIIQEGVDLGAEEEAVRRAQLQADQIDESCLKNDSMSTAEQNELVAELVQQFLLPAAHKTAARHHILAQQQAKMEAARRAIFGLLDDAEIKEPFCTQCGEPLDELCRCLKCPWVQEPVATSSRDDPRWKHSRSRELPERSVSERYPVSHEVRCMLNTLIDEVVLTSRQRQAERLEVRREYGELVSDRVEMELEARDALHTAFDLATGVKTKPMVDTDYRHLMMRRIGDALERSEPFKTCPCPPILPSEVRRIADEKAAAEDPTCRCESPKSKLMFEFDETDKGDTIMLLPSEVRALEELRRCKCDASPTVTLEEEQETTLESTDGFNDTYDTSGKIDDSDVSTEPQ